MHYKIVKGLSTDELEFEVTRHLSVGYLPVGGLVNRIYKDAYEDIACVYMQAMFNPEDVIRPLPERKMATDPRPDTPHERPKAV
jgi:hypothetical protein